jgi:hypothetical protein
MTEYTTKMIKIIDQFSSDREYVEWYESYEYKNVKDVFINAYKLINYIGINKKLITYIKSNYVYASQHDASFDAWNIMLSDVNIDFNNSKITIPYIEPIQYKNENTYKLYCIDSNNKCCFPNGYTGIKYITDYDKCFQINNGLGLLPECKDKIALITLNSKEIFGEFRKVSAIEYNNLIK